MADPSGAAPQPGPNDTSTAILRPKKSYVTVEISNDIYLTSTGQTVLLSTRLLQMITPVHIYMNAVGNLFNLLWTVATLNPATMEILQLFRGDTIIVRYVS